MQNPASATALSQGRRQHYRPTRYRAPGWLRPRWYRL